MYYPTLHLEIARYVQNAGLAGYDIPWTVSRTVGSPPSAMCKPGIQNAPPPAPSKGSFEQQRKSRTRPPSRQANPNVNGNGNGNGKKVTPPGLFDP